MLKLTTFYTVFFLFLLQNESFAQVFSPDSHQQSLLERVSNGQNIRVILDLNIPFEASKSTQPELMQEQREAISIMGARVLERHQQAGFEHVRTYQNLPHIALTTDRDGLLALFNDTDVRSVILDDLSEPFMNVSNAIIGSPIIWDLGFTGEGTAVAVLDTGVDGAHPHFGDRVVAEACFSTTFAGFGSTTLCPDGNNPTGSDEQIGPGAGIDCDTSISGCGHGTHVAGTVAGSSINAGRPINGVAKDAQIIAIQVFSEFDYQHPERLCGNTATSNCVLSYTSDQIAALDWIYSIRNELNIVSANMSLGGGGFISVCDADNVSRKNAMDLLKSVNIATVVASGNNGFKNAISAPACISTAISVGSTQTNKYSGSGCCTDDAISSFSNSASFLDLLAPGHFIESAVPNNGYGVKAGTSMAAPHVAGAWALYRQAFPNATVDEVLAALSNHGVPLTDSNGITKPRIQIDASMLNTETETQLTGSNVGWRQLGSPIQKTTYSEIFSSIWTQGFPGANVTNGTPNIYIYDEVTRSYIAPTDATHVLGTNSTEGNSAAKALFVYVFEDDDFDGIPDGWPKPLNVTGVPNIGDVTVSLSLTPPMDGLEGWHMLSNPFPFTLNWIDVFADATDIHAHAYAFNPNRVGGADYINTDGDWDGKIAPFQGFWVRVTADGVSITFKADHASSSNAVLLNEIERTGLKLMVNSETKNTWTAIYFDDQKSLSPDVFNAFRLSSLSADFLHLFTSDHENRNAWVTQYLSDSDFSSTTIPLHFQTNVDEEFTLKANLVHLPQGLQVYFIDHDSDLFLPIDESFVYTFSVDKNHLLNLESHKALSPLERLTKNTVQVSTASENTQPRFSLVFNRLSTDTEQDMQAPLSFRLSNNYPNPFNPSTRIEFDLPSTHHVQLEVFSITGQRVATLVNEAKPSGTHSVMFDASTLSSGVYIYRLRAGSFVQTRKMTLLK